MEKFFSEFYDSWGKFALFIGLGLAGYLARLFSDIPSDRPFHKRLPSILLIGLPISILSALAVDSMLVSKSLSILPYATAYVAGTTATSIVETLWKLDLKKIFLPFLKK